MTRHEHKPNVRVVASYNVDTLGAPFKVTLQDSVSLYLNPVTGKEMVEIPDLPGLISAVVRARASHPRKLNAYEIKFIRNALGMRAKSVAEILDMSPEHLSRCEAGTKVMASSTEKMFRLFAYVATYFKDPEELPKRLSGAELKTEKALENVSVASKILDRLLTLKIQTVCDADEVLHFTFKRCLHHEDKKCPDSCNDDGEWSKVGMVA